jgi:high-affinity iron transporter
MKNKFLACALASTLVTLAAHAKTGEELYNANCVACHGQDGKADSPTAKALKATNLTGTYTKTKTPSEKYIVEVLTKGVSGTAMAPFPQLNDKEKHDVAKYVMTKLRAKK